MKVGHLLAVAALIGCRTAPAPAPAVRTVTGETTMVRLSRVGDSFTPRSGAPALAAWLPDVMPVDSAGECRLFRTSGNGATTVTAYFPAQTGSRSAITLMFDSAGHLIRFSDRRGTLDSFRPPPGTGPEVLDSVRRAYEARNRTTSISFDYGMDQALAINRGGGRPIDAVIANVRDMEGLAKLGPPTARIQRARRLCGV